MENRESLWKKDFHSKLRRYRISWWLKQEPGRKACILEMQIWEIVHVNRGSIIKHEVPLKRRENGFTATGSFIINFHSVFLFAARITVPAKSLEARNARRRDSFRENGSSFASSYKQMRTDSMYIFNWPIYRKNDDVMKRSTDAI